MEKQSINQLSKTLLKLLESKGYSSGTLLGYSCVLSQISNFMKRGKHKNFTEKVGDLFLTDKITRKSLSIHRQRGIKTTLRRLYDLTNDIDYKLTKQSPEISVPSRFSELLEKYLKFCASIGNKENTITDKRRFCREFLCYMTDAGCKNTCDINTIYICKAILRMNNKDSYAVIRSFLRYLYENGTLNNDLSMVVPKYRRPIPLPTTYTDEEIDRLEKIIDRTTKKGKRNYSIFLLASRLGMRSGDIAEMTFDNIDFNCDCIDFIQNKTGQPLSLPLLPEIRQAITEYMQHARPNAKNNYLFIRLKAPFEKISTSAIRFMLTECFKAAGIDISNKKHGPHTLRSSMASSMVNSDIPYDVVRKTLGHIDPQAIKRYAKVDIENLRLHAIDVPAPVGMFAMILEGRK